MSMLALRCAVPLILNFMLSLTSLCVMVDWYIVYLNIQGLVTMKSLLQKRTIVLSREDFILAMTKENPLFKEFSADGISKFQGIGRAMLMCYKLCVSCQYLEINVKQIWSPLTDILLIIINVMFYFQILEV